jgi:ABC-type Mn2+/Zn2+ transport system permease subunit
LPRHTPGHRGALTTYFFFDAVFFFGVASSAASGVAAIAIAVGVVGSVVGLMLSYYADVASGATIILTLGAIFGLVLALKKR